MSRSTSRCCCSLHSILSTARLCASLRDLSLCCTCALCAGVRPATLCSVDSSLLCLLLFLSSLCCHRCCHTSDVVDASCYVAVATVCSVAVAAASSIADIASAADDVGEAAADAVDNAVVDASVGASVVDVAVDVVGAVTSDAAGSVAALASSNTQVHYSLASTARFYCSLHALCSSIARCTLAALPLLVVRSLLFH